MNGRVAERRHGRERSGSGCHRVGTGGGAPSGARQAGADHVATRAGADGFDEPWPFGSMERRRTGEQPDQDPIPMGPSPGRGNPRTGGRNGTRNNPDETRRSGSDELARTTSRNQSAGDGRTGRRRGRAKNRFGGSAADAVRGDDRGSEPDRTPRCLERWRHDAERFGGTRRFAGRITWSQQPHPPRRRDVVRSGHAETLVRGHTAVNRRHTDRSGLRADGRRGAAGEQGRRTPWA